MKILMYALCDFEPLIKSLKEDYEVIYSFHESISDCLHSDMLYSPSPAYIEHSPTHIIWSPASRLRILLGQLFKSPSKDLTTQVDALFNEIIKPTVMRLRESVSTPLTILGYGPLVSDPLGQNGYRHRPSPQDLIVRFELLVKDLCREIDDLYFLPTLPNNLIRSQGLPNLDPTFFTHTTSSTVLKQSIQMSLNAHLTLTHTKTFKKWIALDLDNTVWEGTLREDGLENIKPNWKRVEKLLNLLSRGFLIWVVSKNDPQDVGLVRGFLRDKAHFDPTLAEMFESKIVGWTLSWQSKAYEIECAAKRLGLSLDHCIFIDDSSTERHLVRELLPQVHTISEKEFDSYVFNESLLFESVHNGVLSQESQRRSESYKENLTRDSEIKELSKNQDLVDVLKSLCLTISVDVCKPKDLERFAELCSRSNQQNICKERRSVSEIKELAKHSHLAISVHAADRFGDYGLIGAMLTKDSEVDTFALSCRLMGRDVEAVMIYILSALYPRSNVIFLGEKTLKNISFIERLEALGLLSSQETPFQVPLDCSLPSTLDLVIGASLQELL